MATFKIVFQSQLQDRSAESLDVAAAASSRPDDFRYALLEAFRVAGLPMADLELLQIELAFKSALEKHWKAPRKFESMLEGCRQGQHSGHAEGLFYEHGRTYGVILLSNATQRDLTLFRKIEALPKKQQVELVKSVIRLPATSSAYMKDFAAQFDKSEKRTIPNAPLMTRPRQKPPKAKSLLAETLSPQPELSQINSRRKGGESLSQDNSAGNKRREFPTEDGQPTLYSKVLSLATGQNNSAWNTQNPETTRNRLNAMQRSSLAAESPNHSEWNHQSRETMYHAHNVLQGSHLEATHQNDSAWNDEGQEFHTVYCRHNTSSQPPASYIGGTEPQSRSEQNEICVVPHGASPPPMSETAEDEWRLFQFYETSRPPTFTWRGY